MVLKCTLKPIGYIFFPFLFLGILLWNISYKTDYNFNRGISIKQLISASVHLSVSVGSIISKKKVTFEKENINNLTSQSALFICKGFNSAFSDLKIIMKDSLIDVCDGDSSIVVDKHITEIEDGIHNDLFVSFNDITVWISELDGANYYAEGIEFITISICIVFRGRPIVSVIHHPFSNETYWAWIGYYKSKNIALKLRRMKTHKSILISKSLDNLDIRNQALHIFGNESKIRGVSGTAYKTIMIIKGFSDYFFHPIPIHKCDVCASYILLLASRGFAFTISNQMKKDDILNKTLLQYKEKISYSLDKHKWLPGILYGKEN